MAMTKRDFKLADYTRISDPDNKMLAELTRKAMGRRTLAEFASLCGVSTATIFRVVNEKVKSPLSDALIVAIAENADPQSGVTKELMIAAHGLTKIEKEESIDNIIFGACGSHSTAIYFEKFCMNLVRDYFWDHGYHITQHKVNDTFSFDFSIETDALSEFGIDIWHFETCYLNPRENHFGLRRKISRIFEYCYFNKPRKNREKVSMIVGNADVFNTLKSDFQNYKIDDVISIILVDVVNQVIVEEYQFPLAENDFSKKIF